MFFNGNFNNYSCYNDQNELEVNQQGYAQNSYNEYANDCSTVLNVNEVCAKNDRLIKEPKISNEELLSFFTDILKNQFNMRDRFFLLDLEKTFVELINHQFITTFSFPPMGSYHRMLVHRTASYFSLGHYADESGKFVIVQKITTTKCPDILLSKMAEEVRVDLEEQSIKPKLILKRQTKNNSYNSNSETKTIINKESNINKNNSYETTNSLPQTSLKTFEQREEEYLKARARIFNDHDQQIKDAKINESDIQKNGVNNKNNDVTTECNDPVDELKTDLPKPIEKDVDKITESIKNVSVKDIESKKY